MKIDRSIDIVNKITIDRDIEIALVLHESLREEWTALKANHNFQPKMHLVNGGAERFHSVRAGLAALSDKIDLVAIHDAVRPLVADTTIQAAFEMAEITGAAIPVLPLTDTIRQLDGDKSITIPRESLWAVQTPQCFKIASLREAYEMEFEPMFTDDASVVERAGHLISLVQGNRTNIKITTPEDLVIAEAFLAAGI